MRGRRRYSYCGYCDYCGYCGYCGYFVCVLCFESNEEGRAGMANAQLDNLIHADPSEHPEIERLQGRIDEIYRQEGKALLIGPEVTQEPVEVPATAFEALKFVVDAIASGQTIVLMPHGTELTTQEAADLLHVSRPHVIKLCDDDVLPYHRVGAHRRLKIEDVLSYRDRRAATRREHLRDLTRESQELEGGYR
jgi:excisionase family DNA binding protein